MEGCRHAPLFDRQRRFLRMAPIRTQADIAPQTGRYRRRPQSLLHLTTLSPAHAISRKHPANKAGQRTAAGETHKTHPAKACQNFIQTSF
jgi:hypothetical protein